MKNDQNEKLLFILILTRKLVLRILNSTSCGLSSFCVEAFINHWSFCKLHTFEECSQLFAYHNDSCIKWHDKRQIHQKLSCLCSWSSHLIKGLRTLQLAMVTRLQLCTTTNCISKACYIKTNKMVWVGICCWNTHVQINVLFCQIFCLNLHKIYFF